MKTALKIFTLIFILMISGRVFSQSQEEMKAWMEYMTPGPVHEMLAKSNGDWTGEVTMWMSPDAPPVKSSSTTTNKMIMGGRYQVTEHKGDMMGMPFEGMGITGYDNASKMMVNTWVDNMGTGIMTMKGPWDEASKSCTLTGTTIDPMTGKECMMKEKFTIIDDNTQKLEMWDNRTGTERKSMEIIFKRK